MAAARGLSAALSALVFAMLMANASAWWFGHGGGGWGGWGGWGGGWGSSCGWNWWDCYQTHNPDPVVVDNPSPPPPSPPPPPPPAFITVPLPTATCARADIPFHSQCTTANGGYCSRCLGKCCLDDGHCPSARCNDGRRDADFCYSNSPYYSKWAKYDRSNCLGNIRFHCNGGYSGSNCPANLIQAQAVCVPFNSDCGKSTWWTDSWWPSTSKGCLGYIYCPNGGCGDWNAAPCIYKGHSRLTQKYNWHAIKYDICSCALTHDILARSG